MFNVSGFWGEFKDLVQSIKADISTNQGIWLAYAFLIIGMLSLIAINVMLMSGTYSLFVSLQKANPEWFFDNPAPLFVYGFMIYLTIDYMKDLHRTYCQIRKIIKKGNR